MIAGYDVTAANYNHRPMSGQISLYITGTPDIQASPAMLKANPGAVLIDQSPQVTAVDVTADVFDVERGAITVAELGQVIPYARAAYKDVKRTGQRSPVVYASEINMDAVRSELRSAKLSGTGLFVAHWGIGAAAAEAMIRNSAKDEFPVRAVQYANGTYCDFDLFDTSWLNTRAARNLTPKAPPGLGIPLTTGNGSRQLLPG